MKTKILNWLGIGWVKWALRLLGVGACLYFIIAGFNSVVIQPIVEKRMEPVVDSLRQAQGTVSDYARTDTLFRRQIGELQLTLREQEKRNKEKVDSLLVQFEAFNLKRTAEFQKVIQALESARAESDKEVLGYARTDSILRARVDSFYANGGRSCYRLEKQRRDSPGIWPGKEWILEEIDCPEGVKRKFLVD